MKTSSPSRRAALLVAAAVGMVPFVSAAPASAAVDPSASVWYEVDVIGTSKTTNVTRYDQVLGSCGGRTVALTCTVRADRSATRTIGTTFGLSVGGVAGSLGISSTRSVTIGSQCSGTTLPPTYPRINGYANGDSYRYTVRQRTYQYGRLTQTKTSVQYAFNPTGLACGRAS